MSTKLILKQLCLHPQDLAITMLRTHIYTQAHTHTATGMNTKHSKPSHTHTHTYEQTHTE